MKKTGIEGVGTAKDFIKKSILNAGIKHHSEKGIINDNCFKFQLLHYLMIYQQTTDTMLSTHDNTIKFKETCILRVTYISSTQVIIIISIRKL